MKAIALLSGGLDSTLAAKIILEQGIELVALHFTSPFCLCDKRSSRESRQGSGCRNEALHASEILGIEIKSLPKGEELFEIIKNPKHGYGSNMNPCIDCRILMFKKARGYMEEIGASFIVTGEVVGQRPMSQKKHIMELIDKEAGVFGLVLRPLCAKILPQTLPEKNNWVKRENLLDISGRSRRPQIEKAHDFNIRDYPCASGGCLLTDEGFSARLKDLLKHAQLNRNEIELLKAGRHFRISPSLKLVVGRNEEENMRISQLKQEGDYLFSAAHGKGPVGLLRGEAKNEDINLSAQIISRYSDKSAQSKVKIRYENTQINGEIEAEPASETFLNTIRI